jgi:hypothetical protein
MGTTFVEIGGKGFWMRDSILELWLRLLALHIEEPEVAGSIGQQIRDDWLLASRGYFLGCVPVRLEEAISTREGRAIVVAAIISLMKALTDGPQLLDHATLNLLGFDGGQFNSDVESKRLIQVGDAFLALIAGQIQTDASSTEFMPGSHAAT